MFKYSTNYLFLLLVLAFSTPTFADVHKWKDANGKTHYGDAPPIAGTQKIMTDKPTEDQVAAAQRTAETNKRGSDEIDAKNAPKRTAPIYPDVSKMTLGQAAAAKRQYEQGLSPEGRQAYQENRENIRTQMQQQQTQNKLDQIQRTQQEIQNRQRGYGY